MPKLSKADKRASISANEGRRRKELALAEIREMDAAKKAGRMIAVAEVERGMAGNPDQDQGFSVSR